MGGLSVPLMTAISAPSLGRSVGARICVSAAGTPPAISRARTASAACVHFRRSGGEQQHAERSHPPVQTTARLDPGAQPVATAGLPASAITSSATLRGTGS
jgi:hypothetical protein